MEFQIKGLQVDVEKLVEFRRYLSQALACYAQSQNSPLNLIETPS